MGISEIVPPKQRARVGLSNRLLVNIRDADMKVEKPTRKSAPLWA